LAYSKPTKKDTGINHSIYSSPFVYAQPSGARKK
jgi:hypothetical protein